MVAFNVYHTGFALMLFFCSLILLGMWPALWKYCFIKGRWADSPIKNHG